MTVTAVPHISVPTEVITRVAGFPISNSMCLGAVGLVVLAGLVWHTRRRILMGRQTYISLAVVAMFEWLLDTTEEVMGDRELARRVAPLGITMFFLILINNWLEILPIVGPVSWHGQPLFRGLSADINFTSALAIITMVTAQAWAFRHLGFRGNLGRYLANPFRDPMKAFVGFLDIIAECSRLIALSMRLFGNIFGGEVLLAVIGFIAAWAAPLALPLFMALELFVGAIQAYIFYMLTVAFIAIGAAGHQEDSAQTT